MVLLTLTEAEAAAFRLNEAIGLGVHEVLDPLAALHLAKDPLAVAGVLGVLVTLAFAQPIVINTLVIVVLYDDVALGHVDLDNRAGVAVSPGQ